MTSEYRQIVSSVFYCHSESCPLLRTVIEIKSWVLKSTLSILQVLRFFMVLIFDRIMFDMGI